MNKYLYLTLCFVALSCTNESLLNVNEKKSNAKVLSRSSIGLSVNHPQYMVSDSAYHFYLTGSSYFDIAGDYWSTSPNTSHISEQINGAYITFYQGGTYDINLGLLDSNGQTYTCDGIVSVDVFEMFPTITGSTIIEKNISSTFEVNYNNIVSNYTVEWNIPSELTYIASGKQLTLTPSTPGTYEIKCRVIEQCPLHNESGVHVSNWCSKTITVIDAVRYDDWIVVNPVKNPGGSLSFDLRYKSSRDGYHCNAMYYVFLYQGAYDGFYASQAWEWEKALNENYYHPPVIDEEYGFVYCDWDYVNNESYISIGKDELYSKFRTISNFPSNKTIDDIEYVILFVRDNKDNVYPQYSSTCEFEYDN